MKDAMKNKFSINHEGISAGYIHCVIITDDRGKPIDFLYLEANNSFKNLMGVKKETFLSNTFTKTTSFLDDKDFDFIQNFGEVAITGKSAEFKFFSSILNVWVSVLAFSQTYLQFSAFFDIGQGDTNFKDDLLKASHLNSLLFDSIPHPALLIRKDRTVVAANEKAKEQGTVVGNFCWKSWGKCLYLKEKDLKRVDSYIPGKDEPICCFFCKGNESLEINDLTNIKIKLQDTFWDIYWVPTKEEGLYLHYAIDITETKKNEEKIKQLSYHDTLTGLCNRVCFREKLKETNDENKLPISIIIGDINGLKLTNDVFGHHEGDKLLKRAAQILKDSCRENDIIARYGGDEFAIVLPNTPYKHVEKICERIKESCNSKNQGVIPISISIGCATKETPEENIYNTFKTAEDRMYRHKILESKSMRNSILSSLETVLHEKDLETKEHASRLVETTAKVARFLGLQQNEMDDLNLFARLHDIGKIMIDESILKKCGNLTDDEYAEIKKHSEAGYRIAESSKEMHNIAEYILTHHERWDGKGYPHGLKEKEIPLPSRILSIADAYDAMTNGRSYRKAMSKKDAIAELRNCSGKQFDPEIVPIFISVIENEDVDSQI